VTHKHQGKLLLRVTEKGQVMWIANRFAVLWNHYVEWVLRCSTKQCQFQTVGKWPWVANDKYFETSSTFLRNVGTHLPNYMVSYRNRPESLSHLFCSQIAIRFPFSFWAIQQLLRQARGHPDCREEGWSGLPGNLEHRRDMYSIYYTNYMHIINYIWQLNT
jgi:hypothetical protein